MSHRTETQVTSLEEMVSTIKSSAGHSIEGNRIMNESKDVVSNAGNIIDSTTHSMEEVLAASIRYQILSR